jgi:predicted TIM-barrel fold metal-dependent hydrolase
MSDSGLPAFNAYRPVSLLKRPAHVPARARFPVIDAHNHLFADSDPDEMLRVMDSVGVRLFVNVTVNCSLPFDGRGYLIRRREHAVYQRGWAAAKPGRFASFTMADFARWDDLTLDLDRGFAERFIEALEQDLRTGALGLKVTKELGLRFRERSGSMIRVDDERLYPVWQWAGVHRIPVLIHTSDPWGFFLPADESNEHYATLLEYPGWSFHDSYFSKAELLEQRTRMMGDNPGTTFICPHVANHPEDLAWVAELLQQLPNVYIDLSARMDELGRQPWSSREFIIAFQDRILFGTDMPLSEDMYRCHFRFLETADEYFDYPGYQGEMNHHTRWKVSGLALPDTVLEKI